MMVPCIWSESIHSFIESVSEVALQSAIMGTCMVWPQLNIGRHRETVVSGLDVIMCGNYTLRRHVYVG